MPSKPPPQFSDDIIQRGRDAARRHDSNQWELGDLAIEADPHENGRTLKAYAEEIGVNYNTLKGYRRVSAAYDQGMRIPSLSFYHHQVVANLDDRMDWLHKAADLGWSAAHLRKEAIPPREVEREEWTLADQIIVLIYEAKEIGLSEEELTEIRVEVSRIPTLEEVEEME